MRGDYHEGMKRRAIILGLLFLCLNVLLAQDMDSFWKRWREAEAVGDWKKAELAMRDARVRFPGRPDFSASLCWALRQQGRPQDALAFIEPEHSAFPKELPITQNYCYTLLDLGWELFGKGDPAAALVYFSKAFDSLPEDRYVMNAYGCALRDTGRLQEGIAVLERGYAAFSDDGYLKQNLAYAYVSSANELVAKGKKNEANKEAEALFRKAGGIDPTSDTYLINYGVYLNGVKRYAEALVLFEKCLALHPTNIWAGVNIQYSLQEMEREKAASGDLRGALEDVKKALARFPGEIWFLMDLQVYASKLGDFMTAESALLSLAADKGLTEYGKPYTKDRDDLLRGRLGTLVWEYAMLGKFDQAFSLISAIDKALPGQWWVKDTRGILLFHSGNIDEGIDTVNAVYDNYIKERPEYAKAVDLPLPLRGTLFVWGNNRRDSVTHAGMNRFCFDFLGADEYGSLMRQGVASPGKNSDYYGFGRDILSVCDGVVEEIENGKPDIAPRLIPVLGNGNYVYVKDAQGRHHNYQHLRAGSVCVRPGETVKTGQKIGELGNSGYTGFAHLHYGLYSPDWKVSLPVRFLEYEARNEGGEWKRKTLSVPASNEIIRY